MSKVSNYVYIGLQVIAWLIFVGLSIEAAALIVNFVFSLYNPMVVKNLYQKLDLSGIYSKSQPVFFMVYGFLLVTAVLKSVLFYLVIQITYKLKLDSPFIHYVAKKITWISYCTLSIGLVSYIATKVVATLVQEGFELNNLTAFMTDGKDFIFMAAVVYIIAVIFKRGVELQTENDLTV